LFGLLKCGPLAKLALSFLQVGPLYKLLGAKVPTTNLGAASLSKAKALDSKTLELSENKGFVKLTIFFH
jgi:hypothetical protein